MSRSKWGRQALQLVFIGIVLLELFSFLTATKQTSSPQEFSQPEELIQHVMRREQDKNIQTISKSKNTKTNTLFDNGAPPRKEKKIDAKPQEKHEKDTKKITETKIKSTNILLNDEASLSAMEQLPKSRHAQNDSPKPIARIEATNTKIFLNDDKSRKETQKLPLPIFVASLPKSATSSSWVYFQCGGYNAAHQWIKGSGKIGPCFQSNVQNGRPPFEGCGDYDVWSDTGYVEKDFVCYQPAVQGLDAIYQAYPNATIVLVTRQPEAWFGSLYKLEWLMTFNKMHHCPGMPNKGATKEDWLQFYENHTQTVRAFAKAHPSITYLEFAVEDPEVASKMEAATGVNATCWGREGKTRKRGGDPKDPSLLTLNQKRSDEKKMENASQNENQQLSERRQEEIEPVKDISRIDASITNSLVDDEASSEKNQKLPLPMFVASLPESGTSSTYGYFKCGGYSIADQWINGTKETGACVESNVQNGRPLFEGCGNHDVWVDTGYVGKDHGCYQPAVQGLDALYQAYPKATILLITLDPEWWFDSLSELRAFQYCPGMPNPTSSKEDWMQFYVNHTRTVRAFAEAHPSMTYHEFSMKNPQMTSKLEAATGVNASCWNIDPIQTKYEEIRKEKERQKEQKEKTQQVVRINATTSKLPLPIFVASLPKSATSSAWVYFLCGGYVAAHQWIKGSGKIGVCFESNVQNGRPPFEGCGDYDVWSDTGYVEGNHVCYQPAVQGLDAIYQAYPNASIVLVTREPEAWYGSFYKEPWLNAFNKMHHCPGMPNPGATKEDWLQFYVNHTQMVRTFAKVHPSITYLEFAVEDPMVASKMEAATGVNGTCWGRQGMTKSRGVKKVDDKKKS